MSISFRCRRRGCTGMISVSSIPLVIVNDAYRSANALDAKRNRTKESEPQCPLRRYCRMSPITTPPSHRVAPTIPVRMTQSCGSQHSCCSPRCLPDQRGFFLCNRSSSIKPKQTKPSKFSYGSRIRPEHLSPNVQRRVTPISLLAPHTTSSGDVKEDLDPGPLH